MDDIRHVAVYLRKSREEAERAEEGDVLDKHRRTLTEIVAKNGWHATYYEELETGESLVIRPQMVKLLGDIQKGLYDAVVVMDIDRLSRGDDQDRGYILNVFRRAGAKIVTPDKVFDPNNELDDTILSFKGFMSREEYKLIVGRLRRGKIAGAKNGMWVNGKPPYPYYYNRVTKTVEVDEEKAVIYRRIVERYLRGDNLQAIAVALNKECIPSPGGGVWHNQTVLRLLVDEFHLGKIINNRTKGSNHKKKALMGKPKAVRLPRSQWIIRDGKHRPLKTEEEHSQILARITQNRCVGVRARGGNFPLSGLVVCAKCGKSMTFERHFLASGQEVHLIRCGSVTPFGERCKQRGKRLTKEFYQSLAEKVINIDPEYLKQLEQENKALLEIDQAIEVLQRELKKQQTALEKIHEAYEAGAYELPEFVQRKKRKEEAIRKIQDEIEQKQYLRQNFKGMSVEELQLHLQQFKESWSTSITPTEQNRLFKSVIEKIVYDRSDDDVKLQIYYR